MADHFHLLAIVQCTLADALVIKWKAARIDHMHRYAETGSQSQDGAKIMCEVGLIEDDAGHNVKGVPEHPFLLLMESKG